MSETVAETGEVAAYLAAIRGALTDLDPADRDDLLEDLEAHLHEVVAESGGASLESSLGSPAAYAAELRTSAGLTPVPAGQMPPLRRLENALAASSLWRTVRSLRETPLVREWADFAQSLRPAWWLARGWLAVIVGLALVRGNSYYGRPELWIVFPIWHTHRLVGVVAVCVAAGFSVWLGRRTAAPSRQLRWTVLVGNVLLVLLAIYQLSDNARLVFGPSFSAPQFSAAPFQPVDGLRLNGRQLVNIFPYDAQGHALQQVRLYDDQGRPLQGLASQTGNGMPIVRTLPTDSLGAQVKNAYPQQAAVQTPVSVDPVASMAAPASGAAMASPSQAAPAFGTLAGLPIPAPDLVVPPMVSEVTPRPSTSLASLSPTPQGSPARSTGTASPTPASKASIRATAHPKRSVTPKR